MLTHQLIVIGKTFLQFDGNNFWIVCTADAVRSCVDVSSGTGPFFHFWPAKKICVFHLTYFDRYVVSCHDITSCSRFELLPNGSNVLRPSGKKAMLLTLADIIMLDDASER